jgi:7-keto-8-aminopelargonate synthetase-like enzyme
MPFNSREMFANLAEKERVRGHHSAEGRAIRTLSRALSGWSAGNLGRCDVIVLCEQAVEDWLKTRLRRSPWSAQTMPALLVDALKTKVISRAEARRLQRIHHSRRRADASSEVSAWEVEVALEFCLELIDKHW